MPCLFDHLIGQLHLSGRRCEPVRGCSKPFFHPEFDPEFEGLLSDGDFTWLKQFVTELRHFLIAHRHAALIALKEWIAWRLDQQNRLLAFERKQIAYLFLSWVNDWHESDEGPEGWVRFYGIIARHSIRLWGWGPAELGSENTPPQYQTLPLPNNRDLHLFECWVVLIAIHDITRLVEERIKPDDDKPTFENVSIEVLYRDAAKLTEKQPPDLQQLLLRLREHIVDYTKQSTSTKNHVAVETSRPSRPTLVTVADLAHELGVDVSKLGTALSKYAKKYPDCRERLESPKRRESQFVYRRESIAPIIKRYESAQGTRMEIRKK